MTRTESARLVGHNYRHLGVTFGKPWERIDRCGPGEYVGRHREPPACICPRFCDAGGFRIADLCCQVHGTNGTDPGDGYWDQ